jgi:hypothetical protein
MMWCNTRSVIGPICFHNTVNLEQHVKKILEPFFEELTEKESVSIQCSVGTVVVTFPPSGYL